MKVIVLLICFILCSLGERVYEVSAALEDDIRNTATLARQNGRTVEQVLSFIQKCGDIAATNRSVISTCDSLAQKFDIDVAKFLVENQGTIEEFLYAYFLPSSVHAFTSLSSTNVTGSTDPMVLAKHLAIISDYSKPISDISTECQSRGMY